MKSAVTTRLEFRARVGAEMRGTVEGLFFFNPRQALVRAHIEAVVDRTGIPEILEHEGQIWIDVPSNRMQCLFACETNETSARPVGVALYCRSEVETLTICHLAVDAAYVESRADVGTRLIGRIRGIARAIKGLRRVELPYSNHRYLPLSE